MKGLGQFQDVMHLAQMKTMLITMNYPEAPYPDRFEPIWLVRSDAETPK
jgi:hypothetical protein